MCRFLKKKKRKNDKERKLTSHPLVRELNSSIYKVLPVTKGAALVSFSFSEISFSYDSSKHQSKTRMEKVKKRKDILFPN